MSDWRRWIIRCALASIGLMMALAVVPRIWMRSAYSERVFFGADAVPATDSYGVAIVFGAGLRPGGEPSPVLADRVATAAELYHAGKVSKLLMTGDNRFESYNEPEAMRALAVRLGVPESDVVLDYAGRRTYDSCYRAREIFGVSRAVLVSQRFHLDRALFLCDAMGIESIGVAADRHDYGRVPRTSWFVRELAAAAAAVLDVHLFRPTPILGEPLPIDARRGPPIAEGGHAPRLAGPRPELGAQLPRRESRS